MDLNQVTELAIKRGHTDQSTFPQNCYLTNLTKAKFIDSENERVRESDVKH
jgi:hypothetical protein